MKNYFLFLALLLIVSCASGKERSFTGSTPANNVVRSFLGIPLTDSVDFIRWKVKLTDNGYQLQCNYGISKPNTNGFINGGQKIALNGALKKDKHYLWLQYGNRSLRMLELNDDLLHLLNEDNSLLIGNGGWSYTLNNIAASTTDIVNMTAKQTMMKDSMGYEGRTPCGVPGVIAAGRECYKLKWYIVFYAPTEKNKPAKYKIPGSPWYKEGGRTGTWQAITGKDGRTIYQLTDDKGGGSLHLLKLDEGVLIFTDAEGKLLAGNEDFSYTINRRW